METMKAIAEVHSISQRSLEPADAPSPVITQQPVDADVLENMEDINLNADDSLSIGTDDKHRDDNVSDAIELTDMLNSSRDDSGISGDVVTSDFCQSGDDTELTIQDEQTESSEPAEIDPKQSCDMNNSQTKHEDVAEVKVHQPMSAIMELPLSEHSQIDPGEIIKPPESDAAITEKQLNQNSKGYQVDGNYEAPSVNKTAEVVDIAEREEIASISKTEEVSCIAKTNEVPCIATTEEVAFNAKTEEVPCIATTEEVAFNAKTEEIPCIAKTDEVAFIANTDKVAFIAKTEDVPCIATTEEVASITSGDSAVTPILTGNEHRPASLDIDVTLDGISTCSFDPEADIPDVRGPGDGKVDQVSLVDVKVEVKDEMALLSKSIAEVQLEDGRVFEAKVKYQRELREARLKLYRMYKTYRQAIEKTKPYYVAKELEREMKAELDQTERDAERAKLNFEAAKETEAIAMEAMSSTKAEHGSIGSQGCEGKEAMENWNQATSRVLETSKRRAEIEDRLRRKEEQFLQAERSANMLFLDLKKFIERAWPYYAMKDQYTRTLEKTRKEIRESGQQLAAAKEKYQETFSRLNLVATEIHQRKTINDRQSGIGANDNFSQFEEIHDIDTTDTVLSALESRAENLSTCLDGLDDDEMDDIESELTIMPKSRSLFSMGRSNTRESLDEILDPKKVLGEKGRRKTLAQINF